jgi:TonB-dependent receptor
VSVAAIGGTVPFSIYDRYQEYGFVVDDRSFVAFFNQHKDDPAYYPVSLAASRREEAEAQQFIQEDILAGYVMGTVDLTPKLRVIGGFRYERTEGTYTWAASRSNSGTLMFPDVVKDVSYGTPAPSVIGAYRFTKNDVLRFGWSRTLARPDWNTLVPVDQSLTLAVADPTNLTNSTTIIVTIRNPNLDPQQSDNLDLSFEHYYGASNLVSIGGFYKKMDNYIGSPITRLSNIQATHPLTGVPLLTAGGQPIFFAIARQENGVQQTVKGLEAVWQHRFLGLPGLLSGLGVNANFTYIEGTRKAPQFLNPADTLEITGYKHFDQVEAQPEEIFHAQIFWERHGISARVGYVNTSAQVDEFDQQGESDRYRAAFKSVDVTLSHEFKNGWKIFIEGNNVTSEPVDVRYFETPNWLATYDQDGSRWTAGITARF